MGLRNYSVQQNLSARPAKNSFSSSERTPKGAVLRLILGTLLDAAHINDDKRLASKKI